MPSWIPTTFDAACKRAAGRRRYHAQRRRARDKRQLIVLAVLLDLNWQSYGAGRILARSLAVDTATISRDIQYLRKWRTSLIKRYTLTERLADAILRCLVAGGVHPRHGCSFTLLYNEGVSSLIVRRGWGHTKNIAKKKCLKPSNVSS